MNKKIVYEKLSDPSITVVRGIKAAAVGCGLKNKKDDLALVYSESAATAAGVFTRNLVQAAPVKLCREVIGAPVQAVVVNSGNANACTGEEGMENARKMAELAAAPLGLSPEQVLVCSTGVIGQQLPMEQISEGIAGAVQSLSGEAEAGHRAAGAILTTDKVTKEVAYRGYYRGEPFHLAGMAKGSGMICPDMATMLAFLYTDLKVSRPLLQRLVQEAVERSFNLITVDGDMSTNDTVLLLACGAAPIGELEEESELCRVFAEMLGEACRELAYRIVSDGEGVTKVITLTLQGASDTDAAKVLARSVLNSPLVKTAFYGEDANWGRILAALGYAGVAFDPDKVDIFIGPLQVVAKGEAVAFSENEARLILQEKEIAVRVDLHDGPSSVTAWGTDLSHDYVSINSHYRS